MKLADLAGWLGAFAMCGAPFIIDTDAGKILAIAGLSLLTIQALDNDMKNLVILNLVSIIGFTYALLF